MKILLFTFLFSVGATIGYAQTEKISSSKPADSLKIVEAACGECMFKMKGDDCELAVRMDGKTYFVDGSKIDDHGDAHADNGFCNKVRKASVSGKVVEGRFVATTFKLLPEPQTTGKQ